MKKIFFLLSAAMLTLSASTCKKETVNCHYKITFRNESDKTVYIRMTQEEYYDTGFPNPYLSPEMFKVEPQSMNNTALFSRDCLEYKFEGRYPVDKILVFVIDEEILQTHPWDEVRAQRLFLKEYELTLEDLRNLDWEIVYR